MVVMVLVVQEEAGEGRTYVIWRARQMHDAVRVINLAAGKVEVQGGGDEGGKPTLLSLIYECVHETLRVHGCSRLPGGKSCHLLLSSICVHELVQVYGVVLPPFCSGVHSHRCVVWWLTVVRWRREGQEGQRRRR